MRPCPVTARALLRGARKAPGCVIPPHETASQATPQPPEKPPHETAARFRRDAGSRRDFARTPFSSGVALPQLLVVRLAKRRPTAARHEQGWWDTT
jgi:hypothetical protein